MRSRLGSVTVLAGVFAASVAGCVRRASLAPSPARSADAAETAIYRLVAESVYVGNTGRAVGVVTTPLDTTCPTEPCHPLAARWGLDPLWWADGDSTSALAERHDLLARVATPVALGGVAAGQPLLQTVAPDSASFVAAHPDTANWTAFKAAHGGASGFVWFSPIGFDPARQRALVFVDWQCGPACGHTVTVSLAARPDRSWSIADMLLVSSREARPGITPPPR